MADFTVVNSSAMAINAPIKSITHIAIKENTNFLKQHTDLELLQAVTTFVANGTYNKPAGFEANDTILALIWAGGGSGAVSNGGGTNTTTGGGGGGFLAVAIPYSNVSASTSVVVGSGGGLVSRSAGGGASNGIAGSDSSFGLFGATGGAAGVYVSTTPEQPGVSGGFVKYNGFIAPQVDRFAGSSRGASTVGNLYPKPLGLGSAGGGSFAMSSGSTVNTNFLAGGTYLGGAGGNAGNDGVNGTAPGGGGGAANRNGGSGNSNGQGARGEVRIYVLRGRVSPQQFLGI